MSSTASDVFDRILDDDAAARGAEDGPAADTAPTVDTDTAAAPDGPAAPRRRGTVLLLGAAAVACAAAAGYGQWQLHEARATAAAGAAALSAAKAYAVTLTTLDATDIDRNYAAALDGATGDFKAAYSLGASQLRQMLIDNHATGRGVVVDAAVKSARRTRAEVLLFVDQSITNAVRSEPRIDHNRIRMSMELVDGRWLAGQVELS